MDLLNRIIMSKKAIFAMVPVIATAIAEILGFDPTSWFLIVLDTAFAVLVAAQTVLDAIHGSASDGTDGALAVKAREKAAIV